MSAQTTPPAQWAATALAGLFAVTGALHFLRPGTFDAIVPRRLPGSSRAWTWASGAAEFLLAGLVASRRYRNLGGLLAAVFLVAVFPANLRTVRVVRRRPLPVRLIALARLPVQAPLIALALTVGRGEEGSR
ncbi:MAG: MauE/DoxX family redox-associated membrane protein [Mycetocola sp.]